MKRWIVVFYRDARGREPVRAWLEGLADEDPSALGRVHHGIELLEEFGVLLEEPYTRQLAGRLRELRAGAWRITYFADARRRMVLLSSFRKRGGRTPAAELRTAM